jgi:hypothetical protein
MSNITYDAALLFLRKMNWRLRAGLVYDCNGQRLVTEGDLVNAILENRWPVPEAESEAKAEAVAA